MPRAFGRSITTTVSPVGDDQGNVLGCDTARWPQIYQVYEVGVKLTRCAHKNHDLASLGLISGTFLLLFIRYLLASLVYGSQFAR